MIMTSLPILGEAAERDDTVFARDADEDGYGDASAPAGVVAGTDCDDNDAETYPVDSDGDGFSSCAGDCDDSDPFAYPGAGENEPNPIYVEKTKMAMGMGMIR